MGEIRVLCVDPDRTDRAELVETIRSELAGMEPRVEGYGTAAEARAAIEDDPVDCLVTEQDLPDGTGLELAEHVREAAPDATAVLYTGADPGEIGTGDVEATVTEFVDRTAPAAATRVAATVEMSVRLRSQVSYPVPDEEEARLAALGEYEFEDGPLAAAFDRLTDLALQHLDADSASVNIIEEHEQRLLACKGLDGDEATTTRDTSICTFTIVENDRVMTVPDVRADPRFEAKQAELEALGVRSYMGAQLLSPDGYRIGTVCIYAEEPREFSAADQDYLRTLADLGVDLLAAHAGADRQAAPAGTGTAASDETADAGGGASTADGADSTDGATGEDDGTSALGEAFR